MTNQIQSINISDLLTQLRNQMISGVMEGLEGSLSQLAINEILNIEIESGQNPSNNGFVTGTMNGNNGAEQGVPVKLKIDIPVLPEDGRIEVKVTAKQDNGISFVVTGINDKKPEVFLQEVQTQLRTANSGKDTFEQAVQISLSGNTDNIKNPQVTELPPSLKNILQQVGQELGKIIKKEGNVIQQAHEFLPENIKREIGQIIEQIPQEKRENFGMQLVKEIRLQVPEEQLAPQKAEEIVQTFVKAFEEVGKKILPQLGDKFQEIQKFMEENKGLPFQEVEQNSKITLRELLQPLDSVIEKNLVGISRATGLEAKENLLYVILQPLRENKESFQIIPEIIKKLPEPQEKNFLSNVINYVKAAKDNDIKQWLGEEIVSKLTDSKGIKQEVAVKLQNYMNNAVHEEGGWKLIEVPILSGENISHIRMAIKQQEEEEKKKKQQYKESGTRFVVDTTFTMLGKLQFDGMSFEQNKNFDLIIRTEKVIPQDINAMIKQIFNETLLSYNYKGSISIRDKENFIRPWHKKEEETTSTGILV